MKAWFVFPGLLAWVAGTPAFADDSPQSTTVETQAEAPASALELALAVGYTEGVGKVAPGIPTIPNIAGPGIGLEGDVGFRVSPHFLVGAYFTGSAYVAGNGGE